MRSGGFKSKVGTTRFIMDMIIASLSGSILIEMIDSFRDIIAGKDIDYKKTLVSALTKPVALTYAGNLASPFLEDYIKDGKILTGWRGKQTSVVPITALISSSEGLGKVVQGTKDGDYGKVADGVTLVTSNVLKLGAGAPVIGKFSSLPIESVYRDYVKQFGSRFQNLFSNTKALDQVTKVIGKKPESYISRNVTIDGIRYRLKGKVYNKYKELVMDQADKIAKKYLLEDFVSAVENQVVDIKSPINTKEHNEQVARILEDNTKLWDYFDKDFAVSKVRVDDMMRTVFSMTKNNIQSIMEREISKNSEYIKSNKEYDDIYKLRKAIIREHQGK